MSLMTKASEWSTLSPHPIPQLSVESNFAEHPSLKYLSL